MFRKSIFLSLIFLFTSLPFPVVAGNFANPTEQQIVVELASGVSPAVLSAVSQKFSPLLNEQSPEWQNWYVLKTQKNVSEVRVLLGGHAKTVELDNTVFASALVYNDPWFTADSQDIDRQWALAEAGFVEAWNKTTGDARVVVAIIDTGLDATHEDLTGVRLMPTYDVELKKEISGVTNTDENGHGTLVAGVISATPNNGKGIVGAAYGVTILPVKALDKEGSGTSSSVSAGIIYAVDKGASIINLSLGGLGFAHDTLLANAIDYAYRKNVLVVAAAGNDAAVTGGSLDVNPVFPICNDNGENMVLGVSAIDYHDLKPGFANFGKACVDVVAPGRRIISTINHDPITGSTSPNSYAYASGTSLAVPFVSSQSALIKSLYPDATPRQIADRIISTASNVDKLNLAQCEGFPCAGLLGAGKINVAKSVNDPILPKVVEGDLVLTENGKIFAVSGGKIRPVVPFVQNQRFSGRSPKIVTSADLVTFPEGTPLEPLDGTLIKRQGDLTVFYMEKGVRLPVSYQVFLSRNFNFAQVVEMETVLVNSWVQGSFLTPKEGTLVKGAGKTVYWAVGGSLHPINYAFWIDRGLNIFPIMQVSEQDLKSFPIGNAFIK